MQKKYSELLNYLLKGREETFTSQQISSALSISVRSVKTYISQINDIAKAKVIISNKDGYTLNRSLAKTFLEKKAEEVPQEYEERSAYIIKQFFLNHVNKLDVYELCDILYISFSTLKTTINKMNKRFNSFGIQFEFKKDFLELSGSEKCIRKLFCLTLYDETDNNYIDLLVLKNNFKDIDVESIIPIIKRTYSKYNYYINDYALSNMLLHISIIIDRLNEGKTIKNTNIILIKDEHENRCVTELCAKLEENFNVTFSAEEKNEIYLLFKASANLTDSRDLQKLNEFVGKEIVDDVEEIIELISSEYFIDLGSKAFLTPFALHLKNLLYRVKNKTNIKNPMLEIIKNQYPIIFDMALFVSMQLIKKHNIQISEDEVAFIAIHIGGEIERQKSNDNKVSTVLLCPNYMNIESKLYNEIMLSFSNDINIIATANDLMQIMDFKIDLLISTINIENSKNYEIAVISPFFTQKDKMAIQSHIDRAQNNKKNRILKKHFHNYFESDLFFCKHHEMEKKEAINLLADNLLNKEFVNDDFKAQVIMRDEAASTAFNKIAIPHSVEMNSYKTCVSVLIDKKGILWDNNIVYVVLMIAINKQDRREFKSLYESLVVLFSEDYNVNLFRECETFESFQNALESIIL